MSKELQVFSMFFLGIGIGSLNPAKSLWGWVIPILIATIFFWLGYYFNYKEKKELEK